MTNSHKLALWLGLLVILAGQLGAAGWSTGAPAGAVVALARIDLESEAELAALAPIGLKVYTQLAGAEGGLVVLAQANLQQQLELAQQSIDYQILESDVQGAEYYLLYGLPEAMRRVAQEITPLLLVEGRQAVAHLTPSQIASIEALGVHTMLLVAQPLSVPAPERSVALSPQLTYSPLIQRMTNQITSSTLFNYVGALSGEQSTVIDGAPYTLLTRNSLTTTPINKATRLAYEHFMGLGLPVDFDYYNFSYYGNYYEKRNVVAEQSGLTQPGRIYLLTAHLDSTSQSPSSLAPGADDNASGSAAVLAIADILSQYHFGCTLRYILFTGEEQGLFGSKAYAAEARALGDNIWAVLNLDMLGYNSAGTPATLELHTRPSNGSDLSIAYLFNDAVTAYSLGLLPIILQDRLSFSDHSPFWDQNYPAILAIEDWNDHTPYYHTTGDRLATLNMPYYTNFVKAALATFAHMGCLLDGEINGVITDATNNQPLQNVRVEARLNGQNPQTTFTQATGEYWMPLINGSYTVRYSAEDYASQTVSGIQIIKEQATVLNRALQPCQTVKDFTISLSALRPSVGQEVSFQAQVGSGAPPVTYSWDFGDQNTAEGTAVTHTYSSPGVYLVKATANNSCDYPAELYQPILVDMQTLYLPVIEK
ncbi:MAG: M28 family peptidase [Anaerolineales bacterium]|nr:M28 family peptidase [Anaerolineales bacterium]